MTYSEQELQRLHDALYATLAEVKRICDKHGIRYFIIGGTAIGAHFWGRILPWDDDIDVGMLRPDYERFAQVAQQEMGTRFFLQTPHTEPHTPFFFMKVRMAGTRFAESTFRHIDMHQGIFVDIFPFDRVPRRRWLEKLQGSLFHFFNGLYIATEIWQWKHCGHCDVPQPRPRGRLQCFVTRILVSVLPKHTIYNIMYGVQTVFNRCELPMAKNIVTRSERLPVADAINAQTVQLGPLEVSAPRNMLLYLNNHYGAVRKDIPDSMKICHRPEDLQFQPEKQ